MKTRLNRVNEKILYARNLINGCYTLYQFALNEICPASWEDRRIDLVLLGETRQCYEQELSKYHRRLIRYQQLQHRLIAQGETS